MNYLHYEFNLESRNRVQVRLDKRANVRLMDQTNFNNYRLGRKHEFYGGEAKVSPIIISAPSAGHWHVVIDLGGYSGQVRASVNII